MRSWTVLHGPSRITLRCFPRMPTRASRIGEPLLALLVRSFSTTSRPALRAASGRPPARQRRDGHRGTGLTLRPGEPEQSRRYPDSEREPVWDFTSFLRTTTDGLFLLAGQTRNCPACRFRGGGGRSAMPCACY